MTGYGSPLRLGSGQNEGQNLFGFSWSSDSSLLASLAGTATGAGPNDPLSWVNYATQTNPGAAPNAGGLFSTPTVGPKECGCEGIQDDKAFLDCMDKCAKSIPKGPIGKLIPTIPGSDAVKGFADSIQQAVNQAMIKLAFVLVALIFLYVGLKKLANE